MRISRASQSGLSLASMMVIVTLVGGIAAALVLLSVNQMKVDQKTRDNVAATYMAEAGVEHMAHLVRKAHASAMNLTTPGKITIDTTFPDVVVKDLLPLGSPDGVGETLETEMVIDGNPILLTAELFQTIPPLNPSDPGYDAQSLDRLTTTKMYTLTAECRFPAPPKIIGQPLMSAADSLLRLSNTSLGRVERVLEYKITPIFDKFAFWDGVMEVQPGPKAIFNGRLHTNKDLHIGGDTGLTINTDYLRANGKVFRHRLDNGATQAGPLTIRDPYKDPYGAQNMEGDNPWSWSTKYESDGAYNPSWNLDDNWLSQVDDLKGKIRNPDNEDANKLLLEPPPIDTIQPDGYYYDNADIVIVDNKVYQRKGGDLVDVTSALDTGTITESTVYDAREAKDGNPVGDKNGTNVPVTVIDVALLQKSMPGGNGNGVIYAYRTKTAEATASSPRVIEGIMLKNGATLANNTTIVSNGPAYVQGDFNKGTDRKGAAIMADAVNILSNAWDGTKSASSTPKAVDTEMNFALVTGNVPTVTNDPSIPAGQRYSGGLENLPRFHENWGGGVKLNYQGSLMSLWPSKISTGRWGKSNVYSPPDRRWDFDARFGDPDAPQKPPLFPQTVHIDRTAYREGY